MTKAKCAKEVKERTCIHERGATKFFLFVLVKKKIKNNHHIK